ncbi:SRPBCC family protein [Halorussus rarus]|uniref:SRPBCC family protein n=1 Tax=Halorussus TaxID=1070314 RepID=UPI000E20D8D9|nr:SRPBCC family protein [Halorussus rarus]NHN58292.1 cyclase [Halorussus sp. JP-T4]
MPTYQREVRVDAPLDDVWAFHSRIGGLEALTPDWMHLRVEGVRGPDGDERDADAELTAGSEIDLSVRPFGVGPRQRWTSRIVRSEESDGAAVFEDVMDDGPFPAWRHAHQFYAVDERTTLVRDRVTYELPIVRGLLGPLGRLGFEPMFRERHRRTRRALEGWRPADGDSRAEHQRSE